MSFSSCLADTDCDLFLDASVFINLSASGAAASILHALPHRVFMVDVAAAEVKLDNRNGRSDDDMLRILTRTAALDLVKLDESGMALFEDLVLMLDDGEAATIAAATSRRAIAVLDERKARRVCTEQLPDTLQASTLDLFAHTAVIKELGESKLSDALHAALQNARMRLRADQREWVVDLIGIERATGCSSIPNSKRDG